MGKTKYGYSEKKLQEKADKRGLSLESYVNYLKMRSHGMIVWPQAKTD